MVCVGRQAIDSLLTVDRHVGRASVECPSSNDRYLNRCIFYTCIDLGTLKDT